MYQLTDQQQTHQNQLSELIVRVRLDTVILLGHRELVKKTVDLIFRLTFSLHEASPEYRCVPPSVHTPGYETNPQKPSTKGKTEKSAT